LSGRGIKEPDKLYLSRHMVPGEEVVAGPQLMIEKLIQDDRAVREIGF